MHSSTKFVLTAVAAGLVVGGSATPVAAAPAQQKYIVAFVPGQVHADVASLARDSSRASGAQVVTAFDAVKAAVVTADAAAAARLARDPRVAAVSPDGPVHADVIQPVPGAPSAWGLDRIDQRARPVNRSYNYTVSAANVHAYVIDTGITPTHPEFGGRASVGADFIGDGRAGIDCDGHGTHVAGTVGSTTYGVAKSVKLVGVRVLDCAGSGTFAGVIAGMNWVATNAVKPAVANMSLGGGYSRAVDIAANNLIESGVSLSVSAGNANVDACNSSPAATLAALTVGSSGTFESATAPETDARSSFSNFGPCLDLFAPGANIRSTWLAGSTNTISGTSMAAPHVAGVAALYLSQVPTANPLQVRNYLVGLATPNLVTSPGTGSPNKLLFAGAPSVTTLDVTPEPVARDTAILARGTVKAGGAPVAGTPVRLLFQATGTTAFVLKATVPTTATGSFAASVKQSVSGTWRAQVLSVPLVKGSVADDAVAVV